MGGHGSIEGLSGREAHLISCQFCTQLAPDTQTHCSRCGAALHMRKPHSLQRVWAWWIAGLIAFIPANTYPIMITTVLSEPEPSTIIGGVIDLISHGSYFVGGVVLVASVLVPVAKFLIVAVLALSIQFRWTLSEHQRHTAHTITEFIGRWSMIDVFVVAVLAALIQLGAIISITPGPAANAFAFAVIFTMLSADSLDPRLFWDDGPPHGKGTS